MLGFQRRLPPSPGSAASGKKALSGTITAVGSTALQPLCEAAAEQFMQENPGVQITVQGGGSGQGVTQIAQGAVQIGNSDVFAESKLKDSSDISKIADNKVCIVGMAPIVNADVTIDDIKLEDLKKIFTGEIANWARSAAPTLRSRSSTAHPAPATRHVRGRRPGRHEGA